VCFFYMFNFGDECEIFEDHKGKKYVSLDVQEVLSAEPHENQHHQRCRLVEKGIKHTN